MIELIKVEYLWSTKLQFITKLFIKYGILEIWSIDGILGYQL